MMENDRPLLDTVQTLAVSVTGAAFFTLIGFPAAVLTGPAAAVSVASILGLNARIPKRLRDLVFLIIGLSIGSTVTPEVVAAALGWPLSFAALVISLLGIIILARTVLIRRFGYDSMTALLAATPGHMSYVLGLSAELNADVPRVILIQSMRVLLLTLFVPVLIAFWGTEGELSAPATKTLSLLHAGILFFAALVIGIAFLRLRVPAPLLLGAMAASAFGHGTGLTPGELPDWVTMAAFVTMGSLIGTRFNGVNRAALASSLAAGAVTTLIACSIAAIAAMIVAQILDLPAAALLLAFAPGGVEVMAALAVETELEPAFVAGHHVFRLITLSVLLPVFIGRTQK